MKDNHFSYPKKGNDIFKKISGFNNACLSPYAGMSPCGDNFPKYIAGYKDAADILVKYIIDNRLKSDSLIIPIIYLYRHYIELSLKFIIKHGRQLFGIKIENHYPKSHKITDLWKEGRKIIERRWPNAEYETFDAVGDIIDQFSIIDPISIDSRYPEQKDDGAITMENLSENQLYINLENMYEIMDSIDNFLSPISDVISIDLSEKKSIESEYSSDFKSNDYF